ncbi:MAG TPA: hypothetical protein VE244_01415 [Nitrososphaeraceae archaeon]|nr:hypothetical protein [Nitrososphaeraceae archaeon]
MLCLSDIYDLGNNQIGDPRQNEIIEVILEKTVIHREADSKHNLMRVGSASVTTLLWIQLLLIVLGALVS